MGLNLIKKIDRLVGNPLCWVFGKFKKQLTTKPDRILFVQLWSIGETVCTIPSLRAIKKKYPLTEITVLATERNKSVFEGYKDYYDHILVAPMSPLGLLKLILQHISEFDLVFDVEEYLNISALLTYFLGKSSVGFSHGLRAGLYSETIDFDPDIHYIDNCCNLVGGINDGLVKYKSNSKPMIVTDKKLVGVCMTLSEFGSGRIWPEDKWRVLLSALQEQIDCDIIIFGGKSESKKINSFINGKEISSCVGKPLDEVFATINKCDLFISSDTGPMHMAAAQGIPVIGLFGPNLPKRYGAYGKYCHNIYKEGVCPHSPCIVPYQGKISECKMKGHNNICMKKIKVKEILNMSKCILDPNYQISL